MKVIIDLIEDIREEIANDGDFVLTAMLLKADQEDSSKMLYAGESAISNFEFNHENRELILGIDRAKDPLIVEDLLKHLLILDTGTLMYEIKLNINLDHQSVELIGFGKAQEDKKYILFVTLDQ